MLYDGHCHVASTRFIPRRFLEDVARNVHRRLEARGEAPSLARIVEGYVTQHQDHLADGLVAEMDMAGVDRAVLLVPDFGMRMETPLAWEDMAREHHAIRLRHPGRFRVFMGADPRRGPEGVRAFARVIDEYGFEGLKLYPPCGYSPSDERLYPYYEICAERRLPVLVHTGPTAGSLDFAPAHPLLIDRAARLFPGVDFILGHAGLTHVDEASAMAAHRPNVYLDIGGFASTPTIDDWPGHLNRLFRLGVNHKIVFGTDWPLGRMAGGLKRLVAEVLEGGRVFAGVPARERELILHGNLRRLLPPEGRPRPAPPGDGRG
ncbi:amidohydrolase family protein [Streptomyces sp. NPDC004270]